MVEDEGLVEDGFGLKHADDGVVAVVGLVG